MPASAGVAGGGLFGAVVGGITANNQLNAATNAKADALRQWLSVNVPDPAQQAVELQKYQVTGQLSPELETAFQQSQSNLQNMQIDPTSRSAEVQALSQMQNIANKGGLDAQAMQQEQQAINASNANEQGQRGAITQGFARRGMGGSGAQLAAELEASQGDANNSATQGMNAAANAEQRSLQAMTNASSMGSNLNSQDYTQAANAAAAQDSINRFNTQQQQNVANTNTNAQNNAQAANLANSQSVANANTGLTNQQEMYNKGLSQQNYENQLQKATGSANAENGVATQANLNAQAGANQWSNIGQAIGQGAAAIGKYNNDSSSDDDDDEESET